MIYSREIYVPRWIARPWSWLWSKMLGARIDAVTIRYTRFYFKPDPSDALRTHELEHVHQCVRLGTLRYWYEYTCELLIHGYHANRFEVEARQAAGQE